MKVLFISYDGLTDPLGQSQVLPYLIGLSQKGFKITVLSCDKPFKLSKHHSLIDRIVLKYNIKWVSTPYYTTPRIFSTVLHIRNMKNRARILHKEIGFDIVHSRSLIPAIVGNWLKKRYGIKFIFDMRGLWADERIEGGIWNINNPLYSFIYRYLKNLEAEFLGNADYTVSLTETMKNIILKWKNVKNQPINIKVIPCCTNTQLFSLDKVENEKAREWKASLKIQDTDYIVTYLGSLGTWYMLDEMLAFFKELLIERPTAKFLFITGNSAEILQQQAAKQSIHPDKILCTYSSRADLPSLLSLSSVSIFFIKPVYSKKASSPTKLAELLSMGIPIICNADIGDINQLMEREEVGILVDDFTSIAFQKAIGQLDFLDKIPKSTCRAVAQKYFSLEKGVQAYNAIYSS